MRRTLLLFLPSFICARGCLRALPSHWYLHINPGTCFCLRASFQCMRPCGCAEPIYIHVLLPFQSFFTPRSKCVLFWLCSVVPAAQSLALPYHLLLFIMHGTLLVYCRHKALHHHSLQRKPEADGKMGSRFKKNPIRRGYPLSCQARHLVFSSSRDVLTCWIIGSSVVHPYILRLLATKFLAIRGQINVI